MQASFHITYITLRIMALIFVTRFAVYDESYTIESSASPCRNVLRSIEATNFLVADTSLPQVRLLLYYRHGNCFIEADSR